MRGKRLEVMASKKLQKSSDITVCTPFGTDLLQDPSLHPGTLNSTWRRYWRREGWRPASIVNTHCPSQAYLHADVIQLLGWLLFCGGFCFCFFRFFCVFFFSFFMVAVEPTMSYSGKYLLKDSHLKSSPTLSTAHGRYIQPL